MKGLGVRYMSLADRTPGGAQTRSKQHAVFGGPPFPQTLMEATGAYTWDDASRKYIDWMSALASVGLGHRYPDVELAVQHQMAAGTALSLPTQLEYEVTSSATHSNGPSNAASSRPAPRLRQPLCRSHVRTRGGRRLSVLAIMAGMRRTCRVRTWWMCHGGVVTGR